MLSLIYVFSNGILTSMLAAEEWTSFGSVRSSLRVSDARQDQHSTYWLSIPFKYGVCLLVSMTLLHWLVSQGVFVASLDFHSSRFAAPGDLGSNFMPYNFVLKNDRIQTCGYSMVPLICAMALAPHYLPLSFCSAFEGTHPTYQ